MIRVNTFLIGFLLLACAALAPAQIDSTKTSGNWNSASTWQSGTVPTGSGTYIVRSSDSLYFNVATTITGTVRNLSGRVGVFDSSKVTLGNGSTYENAINGGTLPKVVWATGSTCLVTGAVGNSPSNGNQNFYNLTWDCIGQTGGLNLGMTGNTIAGDVRVIRSNSQYFRLTASNNLAVSGRKTITINGNIFVDSTTGFFTSTGSSGADSFDVVLKGGIVSYGTFNVANGSGASMNLFVAGDVKALGGAFTTNSATAKPDSLIFNGTKKQVLMRATSSMSNIQFAVRKGASIDFDTSSLGGSANTTFTLEAGATIITGHAKGIKGNLNNGGATSLSAKASYVYDGVAAQIDSLMPTTVNNLTINNTNGVVLVNPTTINGVLTLTAGVFDNTVPFTLGPTGSISYGGGSLKIPVTAVADKESSIPRSFFVKQNYPNPFNPSTSIVYGLPNGGYVSAKVYSLLGQEVATLFDGYQNAGIHTLVFNASNLSSGVYLYHIHAGSQFETKRMILMK